MTTTGTKTKIETATPIWTDDEEQVFQELGIAASDVTQQLLVRGIRRAIGRLVAANLDIVKAIKEPYSVDLSRAEDLLMQVAGEEPPRCQLPD
jgi:hypothetical protein